MLIAICTECLNPISEIASVESGKIVSCPCEETHLTKKGLRVGVAGYGRLIHIPDRVLLEHTQQDGLMVDCETCTLQGEATRPHLPKLHARTLEELNTLMGDSQPTLQLPSPPPTQ